MNIKKAYKAHIIIIIVGLLLFLLFTSCKSKTIYVPVESTKIEYRDKIQRDSIHLYDSIYFEKYLKGDTVFLTKEKYKYLYRDKLVHDSIFKLDSIKVPYPVIEYQEVNRLSSFQSFQIWCGRILLLLVLGYFVFRWLRK